MFLGLIKQQQLVSLIWEIPFLFVFQDGCLQHTQPGATEESVPAGEMQYVSDGAAAQAADSGHGRLQKDRPDWDLCPGKEKCHFKKQFY